MSTLPIAAHTAAALTLILTALSYRVSRLRMHHRVSFGDGGHSDLLVAIRTHGNALEQSLLFLLLLVVAELQRGGPVLAFMAGAFVAARLLHPWAVQRRRLRLRQASHLLSVLLQLTLVGWMLWPR